jgi:hypothetical protein
MKTFLAVVGSLIAGLIALVVLTVVLGGMGLGGRYINMKVEAWFAPQEQNIQREIFENTKSFNEGKEQELVKFKFEWEIAKSKDDEGTMSAVESAVRHTFADYEEDRLSPELQDFVRHCKYGGLGL